MEFFKVARKSNIIWVVTYAQVAALSFSASVSNIFENQRVGKSGCLSTIVGEPFIYLMSCLQIDATCKKLRYLSAGGRVNWNHNLYASAIVDWVYSISPSTMHQSPWQGLQHFSRF